MSRMAAVIATERRLRTRTLGASSSSKMCKLAKQSALRRTVAGSSDWIGRRADRRLAEENDPEDECNQVSHETSTAQLICTNTWRAQERAAQHLRIEALDASLQAGLIRMAIERGISRIIVSIRQRPARLKIGRCLPLEGDLLSGPNNSYIATLVERHTRYDDVGQGGGKDTRTVVTRSSSNGRSYQRSCISP